MSRNALGIAAVFCGIAAMALTLYARRLAFGSADAAASATDPLVEPAVIALICFALALLAVALACLSIALRQPLVFPLGGAGLSLLALVNLPEAGVQRSVPWLALGLAIYALFTWVVSGRNR